MAEKVSGYMAWMVTALELGGPCVTVTRIADGAGAEGMAMGAGDELMGLGPLKVSSGPEAERSAEATLAVLGYVRIGEWSDHAMGRAAAVRPMHGESA